MEAFPRFRALHAVPLAVLAILLTGSCTTPEQTPSLPADTPEPPAEGATSVPVGLYRLTGDPSAGELTLAPMTRANAALADNFDVDLTALSSEVFKIRGFRLEPPAIVVIEFSWTHPIPDTAVRKDLAAFDFRMHLLREGGTFRILDGPDGLSAPVGGGGAPEPISIPDLPLLNFSGFSTWADEVVEPVVGELPGNCYPFITIHEDNDRSPIDPDDPVGWNVIPQNTSEYGWEARVPILFGSSLDLMIALEVSFGSSASPAVTSGDPGSRANPRYFTPEFNLKEAWKTTVAIEGAPIFAGVGSDSIDMTLTAFDHQGPLDASGAFDPLTAPLSALRYRSALDAVTIAVPGTMDTPLVVPGDIFTGDGTPLNPYEAIVTITGDRFHGPPATYAGIVAFHDTMIDVATATSPLPTKGYARNETVQERYDFTAYQIFFLQVQEDSNEPPVADLDAIPTTILLGETTNLAPGTGTDDPDGLILTYDYDFDYDGITFDVDASRATASSVETDPVLTPGIVTMAMRVTDNGVPAKSDIDTIDITVTVPAPTWTDIHTMIAGGDPAVSNSSCIQCHATGSGGLFMTADPELTYNNIVNVLGCAGLDYIEPSDSANSLIYRKISQVNPPCGVRMPENGQYWTPTAIGMVQTWIDDGAQGP